MVCKKKLEKILAESNINTWAKHDQENNLSIMLIQKDRFDSWYTNNKKELTILGNFKDHEEDILLVVRKFVSENSRMIMHSAKLYCMIGGLLYRSRYGKIIRTQLTEKEKLKIIRSGFKIDGDWIIWDHKIPLLAVIKDGKFINIDKEKSESFGYGIVKFKVMIDKTFKSGVFCEGFHPNLNPINGKFCLDRKINDLRFNYESLHMLCGLMTHANITDMYNRQLHLDNLNMIMGEKYV